MADISRRDFLKSSVAGAASLTLASLGLGALSGKASADGVYTPGTYSATAIGMGTVTVTATFDENSIVNVVLDVSEETPAIGQLAADELTTQVLTAQSAEIDGVSGATLTSNAVKLALKTASPRPRGRPSSPAPPSP